MRPRYTILVIVMGLTAIIVLLPVLFIGLDLVGAFAGQFTETTTYGSSPAEMISVGSGFALMGLAALAVPMSLGLLFFMRRGVA